MHLIGKLEFVEIARRWREAQVAATYARCRVPCPGGATQSRALRPADDSAKKTFRHWADQRSQVAIVVAQVDNLRPVLYPRAMTQVSNLRRSQPHQACLQFRYHVRP